MSNIHNGIFLTNTNGAIEEYSNNIGSNKVESQSKYNAIFIAENNSLKEYANNLGCDDEEPTVIVVEKPTITVGTYTYNGTAQGPIVVGELSKINISGASYVNAGSYTLTISLKDTSTMIWDDSTTEDITVPYTIDKANSSIQLSSDNVTISNSVSTQTVTLTVVGEGVLSVINNNTDIYNMNFNSSNNTITITDINEKSGSGTISISLSATNNYNSITVTLNVTASFTTLYAWSSATNEQIQSMLNDYYNGVLSLEDIQTVWHIGDVRTVNLSAMSATGVGESHRAQTVQMEILDFDHDELTTPIGNKTKALISIGQKNCLMDLNTSAGIELGSGNTEHGTINYINSSTQWSNSERRTWCNNIYYKALPSTFKSMVKQVNKLVSDKQGNISISADYCWFYSEIEVSGEVEHSFAGEGTQYELFNTSISNRYKNPAWSDNSSSDIWLLRSINKYEKYNYVYLDGTISAYINIEWDAGIAPAMCL